MNKFIYILFAVFGTLFAFFALQLKAALPIKKTVGVDYLILNDMELRLNDKVTIRNLHHDTFLITKNGEHTIEEITRTELETYFLN